MSCVSNVKPIEGVKELLGELRGEKYLQLVKWVFYDYLQNQIVISLTSWSVAQ
jgi:hypothetical protein